MPAQASAQTIAAELEKVNSKVPALFDRKGTFYPKIEKRQVEKISNRDMRIPLELRPGGYFGHYDPDGGDLGRGAGSFFDKAVINTVHLRYAVEWTKKAEWGSDDSSKSVINVFKHNLAKAMPEFRRGFDALCMTDGNGVLAVVASTSNAAGEDTVVLTNQFGAKLLRFGQRVKVFDTTLATDKTVGAPGYREITYLDYATRTIKFATTATLAPGDKIVIEGAGGTPPVSLYGVPYHHNSASTGAWLGFNRATTPEIRANSVSAAGSALTLPFPRLAINKMMDRTEKDGENISLDAWMHPCQQQAYEELGQLVTQIQKSPKEESLNLYFGENMQMAGAPVKTSFMWDKTRIDFIHYEFWGRAEMHPAGFYDVDGRKIWEARGASGGVATSQMFYLVASWNLFMTNPAAGVYISDLQVPTGY